MFQPRWRRVRVELEAFVSYSNLLASKSLGGFTKFSKSVCPELNSSQSQTCSSSCVSYLSDWRQHTWLPQSSSHSQCFLCPGPSPASSWPLSWMASIVFVPTEPGSPPVPWSELLLLPAWLSGVALLWTARPFPLPYFKSTRVVVVKCVSKIL